MSEPRWRWRADPLPGAAAFGLSRAQQKEVRALARKGWRIESAKLAEPSRRWAASVLNDAAEESGRKTVIFALLSDLVLAVIDSFAGGTAVGDAGGDFLAKKRTRRVARQVMDAAAPTE